MPGRSHRMNALYVGGWIAARPPKVKDRIYPSVGQANRPALTPDQLRKLNAYIDRKAAKARREAIEARRSERAKRRERLQPSAT
jgi:hypothetical protein